MDQKCLADTKRTIHIRKRGKREGGRRRINTQRHAEKERARASHMKEIRLKETEEEKVQWWSCRRASGSIPRCEIHLRAVTGFNTFVSD